MVFVVLSPIVEIVGVCYLKNMKGHNQFKLVLIVVFILQVSLSMHFRRFFFPVVTMFCSFGGF